MIISIFSTPTRSDPSCGDIWPGVAGVLTICHYCHQHPLTQQHRHTAPALICVNMKCFPQLWCRHHHNICLNSHIRNLSNIQSQSAIQLTDTLPLSCKLVFCHFGENIFISIDVVSTPILPGLVVTENIQMRRKLMSSHDIVMMQTGGSHHKPIPIGHVNSDNVWLACFYNINLFRYQWVIDRQEDLVSKHKYEGMES